MSRPLLSGGFTLSELLVALLILQVGILAAMGLGLRAAESLARAERMERALTLAERAADSLAHFGFMEAGEGEWGSAWVRWEGVAGDPGGGREVRITAGFGDGDPLLEVGTFVGGAGGEGEAGGTEPEE